MTYASFLLVGVGLVLLVEGLRGGDPLMDEHSRVATTRGAVVVVVGLGMAIVARQQHEWAHPTAMVPFLVAAAAAVAAGIVSRLSEDRRDEATAAASQLQPLSTRTRYRALTRLESMRLDGEYRPHNVRLPPR
jgi:hypothetical protein